MKNKQKKMLCTHPMQGYKQNPANQLDNNAIYFFSAARKEKKRKKEKAVHESIYPEICK